MRQASALIRGVRGVVCKTFGSAYAGPDRAFRCPTSTAPEPPVLDGRSPSRQISVPEYLSAVQRADGLAAPVTERGPWGPASLCRVGMAEWAGEGLKLATCRSASWRAAVRCPAWHRKVGRRPRSGGLGAGGLAVGLPYVLVIRASRPCGRSVNHMVQRGRVGKPGSFGGGCGSRPVVSSTRGFAASQAGTPFVIRLYAGSPKTRKGLTGRH